MSAIRVELELKDGSFVSGMLRAGQSLDSFRKELARLDPHFRKVQNTADGAAASFSRVDGSTRTMLGTFRDLSIVAGATTLAFQALTGSSNGLISNIIKINAEMEKLKFQMVGMSQASDPIAEAAANVEYLRQKATEAPFSIRELTSTFVKLKAAGIDDTNKSMQALVDGIAAFGGSDEQLHRVTLGISQMAGKGVIQMEEMRQQLGESMPTAMRLMARSMGISVAELVDAIGTGKLEARAALAKFTDELNRAYGGSALRMMQTFSGQVTQMSANFQRLATEDGGQLKLFFDNIKGYLAEFNQFLASPAAAQMANQFGAVLNSIASTMVAATKAAYAFREEIKYLAMAFAGAMIAKTISSAIQTLGMNFVLARAQAGVFFTQIRAGTAVMTGAAATTLMTGQAARAAGMAFAGARVAAIGFGGALLTFAPYLAIAATGIALMASKFDVLGTKTDEAYQNLLAYGAESRAQAKEILDAKEGELRERLAELRDSEENGWDRAQRKRAGELADGVETQLRRLISRREELIERSGTAELEAEKSLLETKLEMRAEAAHREYNRAQTEVENQYQEDLNRVSSQEGAKQEDIAKIQEEYRKKLLENEEKLLREKIRIRDEEMQLLEAEMKKSADLGFDGDAARYSKLIDSVKRGRLDLMRELNNLLTNGRAFGTDMLADSPMDSSKLVEDGQKELSTLREEISGMEADIAGASGEYAKLMFRIRRGDYGNIEEGSEEVRKLTEDLKAATLQKEALDKIMNGREELTGDIEALREKIRVDTMDLEARRSGKELNEADRILQKLRAGYYEGLGPIENIRNAVMNLADVTNTQGLVAQEAARVMSEQTFGQKMMDQINMIRDAIFGVTGALQGMSGTASSLTLGGFGMPGASNIRTNVDGGILDLIAQRESGGDYNATLDNGRWTNGPQNLTSMTLAQVRQLQDQMLANPQNRALYGNGLGSSALGRYQIVGKTLQGLMDEMGLTGNELYDEGMQDELARRLFARRGANPVGLRQEWAGLNGVSDQDIMAAISRSTVGPTRLNATLANSPTPSVMANLPPVASAPMNTSLFNDQIVRTQEAEAELEAMSDTLDRMATETDDLDLLDMLNDLKEQIVDTNKPLDQMGKNYERVLQSIKDKGGNVLDPKFQEILATAKELDRVEKARDDRKSASTAAEEQLKRLEEERAGLQRQIAEAQERAQNPDYEGTSDDLAELNKQFDEYLSNIEIASGKESKAYQDALAYKQAYLADANALRQAEIVADLNSERRDIEDSMLTEGQMRQVSLQRELAMVDQRAQQLRAAGMEEVEITRLVEEQKAAIRAKYAQEGVAPIGAQMKEWADLQGNLEQSSAKWMDSAASGIAGLLTGTGDLRSVLNGMLNDIANMGVRFAMSQMMPAGGKAGAGKASGGAGKAASAAGKVATGGKMPIPVKHTGGIAGVGGGSMRMASMAAFAGAKRYHTGGIIGGATALRRNEVPIIAEKGEGVFTSDQMKALGGLSASQSFQINAPVSVNGSSGTPEQNADLAKRISQEMEGTMRAVVMDEMRKQIRPGNMMNNGAR